MKKHRKTRKQLLKLAKYRRQLRAKHRKVIALPRRKGLAGERTLNATLRNAARSLRWVEPQLRNRELGTKRFRHHMLVTAAALDMVAHTHLKRLRRATKRQAKAS